jgi:hypothetical protein
MRIEFYELLAVLGMLYTEVRGMLVMNVEQIKADKITRVNHWLEYSREKRTLS